MKLHIEFISPNGYPVSYDSRDIGLNGVDRIREYAGHKIPLDVIHGGVMALRAYPRIKVSEEVARKSGHFWDRNTVCVTVPAGGLNRFVRLIPHVERADSGEVLHAELHAKIDNEAVVRAWEEAGFPLQWDLTEFEEE